MARTANRSLLSQKAYELVKNGIMSGAFEPGTSLAELDLSKRFKIGRTPIREAIRRLASEGLVRLVENKGAFVTQMAFTDVEEALFLRELLEIAALRRAIHAIPSNRLQELDDTFAACEKLADGQATNECLAADVALHELIVNSSRSPRLIQFHRQLADQIHWIRQYELDRVLTSIPEHRAIINALRRRDITEAEKVLHAHMASVREFLYHRQTGA